MSMTTEALPEQEFWRGEAEQLPVSRQRVRGLRLRRVPSWPLVMQVAGGVAALAGVYLRFGLAATLIVGGVALLALGTLREAEVI